MKNSVRIKMMKMERIADFIDTLQQEIEYLTKQRDEILNKPEDERAYWETQEIPNYENKIDAYNQLIKDLEKMC